MIFKIKVVYAKGLCLTSCTLFVFSFFYLLSARWELHVVRKGIILEKGEDAVKDSINQEKMVFLQTELESQLVAAAKGRQDAEKEAAKAYQMMQKAFQNNMQVIEAELTNLNHSSSNIIKRLSCNDFFTNKLLDIYNDDRSVANQKWLKQEMEKVTEPLLNEFLDDASKMRTAFIKLHQNLEDGISELVRAHINDKRKHGKHAVAKLHDISKERKKGELESAYAQSLAQKALLEGRYSNEQINQMLDLFFQHAHAAIKQINDMQDIEFHGKHFSMIRPDILLTLEDLYKRLTVGQISTEEVTKLVRSKSDVELFEGVQDAGLDVMKFLEETITSQKRVNFQSHQKALLHVFFQAEIEWHNGGIDSHALFQSIQENIKAGSIPVKWLIMDVPKKIITLTEEMKSWLKKRYNEVSEGKLNKKTFYSEIMDLYQEGKISYAVMDNIVKLLVDSFTQSNLNL